MLETSRLIPWDDLDCLESGEMTEFPLGPGLVLTPKDLRGETSLCFPMGIYYSGKTGGK